jgi:hypothetical protein
MSRTNASDDHRGDVPPPDAAPEPGEQAQAESFGRLVDRLLSDEPLPPVMTSDERALVDVAAVVRACTGAHRLDALRQQAVISEVMARAERVAQPHLLVAPGSSSRSLGEAEHPAAGPGQDSGSTAPRGYRSRRRGRFQRALPWTVAAVSVAAALLLALRTPRAPAREASILAEPPRLDALHRSRPADSLVGEIPRRRAAAASDRIDMIYADRLMGYRDLRLRGGRQ